MGLTQFMYETRVEFPGFQIRHKSTSLFMRLLAFLLWVVTFGQQKSFMTNYVTTIGQRVYVPEEWGDWDETERLAILRHERVHMRQAQRHGTLLFAVLYLLAPLPLGLAWYRARFEWEAYEESMRAAADQHGYRILEDAKYKASILEQFTTGAYGWMWPFPATLEEWYEEAKLRIRIERSHGR